MLEMMTWADRVGVETIVPELCIGGTTVAGARRAARLRCGFSPAVADLDVIGAYFDECARIGFAGADVYGCTSLDEFREQHRPDASISRSPLS